MTNVILNGCNGRMGQVIAKLAAEDKAINIVCGFDLEDKGLCPFPVYTDTTKFTGDADVVIDFSHPSALANILDFCKSKHIGIIVATTGIDDAGKQAMNDAAESIPVFYSANMSLGVNLLIELCKKAAKILDGSYDIEIIEKHHNQKLDAPSGTALAIADAIKDTVSYNAEYVYDRTPYRKKRDAKEIGIHAVRGGTIVGEHDVLFAGNNEVIEIKHTSQSRDLFANGAIKAAKFLARKPAGMYSMSDLIND